MITKYTHHKILKYKMLLKWSINETSNNNNQKCSPKIKNSNLLMQKVRIVPVCLVGCYRGGMQCLMLYGAVSRSASRSQNIAWDKWRRFVCNCGFEISRPLRRPAKYYRKGVKSHMRDVSHSLVASQCTTPSALLAWFYSASMALNDIFVAFSLHT